MNDLQAFGPSSAKFITSPQENNDVFDFLEDIDANLGNMVKQNFKELFDDDESVRIVYKKSLEDIDQGPILQTIHAKFADKQKQLPQLPLMKVAQLVAEEAQHEIEDTPKEKLVLQCQKPNEKPTFRVGPNQGKDFKDKSLLIEDFDKKQGKVVSRTLSPDSYNVVVMSAEQYARITSAAITALDKLSATLQKHQERMKEIEVEGKYPLGGRVSQKEDTANKAVLDLMKNQTQHFLSMQRKKEDRQKELQQEEQYREEQDAIKRRTQQADLKFEGKLDQIKRDDIQREDIKKDFESQENKAA